MANLPRLTLAFLALALSAAAQTGRPVIVELFTSEGCSSCPPADEMLARLETAGAHANARIIALEEHVDYWNTLGWTDRFALPIFRSRQSEYAGLFGVDSIYTPQLVINGRAAMPGADPARVTAEIERAAANPVFTIQLTQRRHPSDPALVELSSYLQYGREGEPDLADVYLAVTESRLRSRVAEGENAGRVLRHGSVVRSFGVIGGIDRRPFHHVTIQSTLKLPAEWKRENLRAVVFVQERASRRITGADVADLR